MSRFIRHAFLGIIALFLLWLGGFACFVSAVTVLKPLATPVRTDAIIVLTGGMNRINTGMTLLRDKLADKMLISGVDERVTVDKLVSMWNGGTEAPCCITLGHAAHNTTQNAEEARAWAEKEKIKSIRLVTSSYHLPRAWLEFRHALPADTDILLHPVPYGREASGGPDYEKKSFWVLVFGEYNKTIMTWLRLWPQRTETT